MLQNIAWIVLFAPLAAAGLITLVTRKDDRLSAQISIGACLLAFVVSLVLFCAFERFELSLSWLDVGDLKVDLGFKFDALSGLMLLVVTGVGSAIHVYSFGYMLGDRSFSRFFGSMSLFMFSMLGIVVSNNLVQMFVFWELVGVSSYLLIGFWFERASAADACKKAFLANRVGDFGFLLGILMVWGLLGTVRFEALETQLRANPGALGAAATVAGLLLFCGAVGKSAQFPLHVWLPDAMEGPTPVSALIHAATMVAAGVFMLCRVFFILDLPGSHALQIIAWIGAGTALLAALIAVQQDDIKRILAYSTLSQLGMMVMAVGLGGPGPAMVHLVTHAFFKALLFLGAGSVIHAMHHEQDIWKMGQLSHHLPVTTKTFLIGALALCGVPPFSGFYSKDAILAQAFEHNTLLFLLAISTAWLTTFYMSRLVLVVFFGKARTGAAERAHESPGIMTWPLIVLAVPSVIAGLAGIPGHLAAQFGSGGEGHPGGSGLTALFEPFSHSPGPAFLGMLAFMLGVTAAYSYYWGAKEDPLPAKLGWLSRAMKDRFYFDEIYAALVRFTQDAMAAAAEWIDRWIIAGLMVRGAHGTTELVGRALRLAQTGNLQTYAFFLVLGVAWMLFYTLVLH